MSYNVSYFIGDQTNVGKGEILYCKEFENLASKFRSCMKGKKHAAYFVRGVLNDGHRRDSSLSSSSILVIDGDRGVGGKNAPKPLGVHSALKELGLNHFIYTTHSHSAGVNKFRVVIPCTSYTKKDLKVNTTRILKLLARKFIRIEHVTEMDTWSQPWFVPTRDDPKDGLYEYYEYFEGDAWESLEGKVEIVEDKEVVEKVNDGSSLTLQDMKDNILSGKEFHESTLNLTYQLCKDGMSKAMILMLIQGLYEGSKEAGTERWQTRYDELERTIEGGMNRANSEGCEMDFKIDDKAEKEYDDTEFPKPHGLYGKFVQETKEFMLYEDYAIAFVSASFILSSIAGRKFNVDIHNKDGMAKPTALNMYFTLAAETGVGKSEIEDAVENCYMQFSGTNGCIQNFFYKGRLSGPRALYRIYEKQRSVGIIANEAGIEGQGKTGDTQGLKGAWLNLYGQGAWKKYTGASELSDSDNSIKSIRAVAISRVSESTPVELAKFYRQGSSVENGLVPRENIFVIKHLNEVPNKNIRLQYSEDVIDRFNELLATCNADVSEDSLFKPYIITVEDEGLLQDMLASQMRFRKLQNKGSSIHERAMSGRMFVKMLRYCGIITVINKSSSNKNALVIEWPEWEWAKRMVEYEYARINDVVALTSGNDMMDGLVEYVAIRFGVIMSDTIGNKELRVNSAMRKKNTISLGTLRKACRTNTAFKEIEGDPKFSSQYKSGFDKVIEYMVKNGLFRTQQYLPLVKGTNFLIGTEDMTEYLKPYGNDVNKPK